MNKGKKVLVGKVRLRAPEGTAPENRRHVVWMMARADLVRVARLVGLPEGEAPSAKQYQTHGRYGTFRIFKVAGRADTRWVPTMEAFRLGTNRSHRKVPDAQLVADVLRVAILLGRPEWMPTTLEYAEHGKYSTSGLRQRLGEGRQTWRAVANACGLRWRHALARPISREELIDQYRALCKEHGCRWGGYGVGQAVWKKSGGICERGVAKRFGSWSDLIIAAGYKPLPWKGGGQAFPKIGERGEKPATRTAPPEKHLLREAA